MHSTLWSQDQCSRRTHYKSVSVCCQCFLGCSINLVPGNRAARYPSLAVGTLHHVWICMSSSIHVAHPIGRDLQLTDLPMVCKNNGAAIVGMVICTLGAARRNGYHRWIGGGYLPEYFQKQKCSRSATRRVLSCTLRLRGECMQSRC